MIRGTTNPKTLAIEGFDLSLADEIHVTISQGDKVIDTTDVTLHEHSAVESRISFALSETDSLSLSAGRAKIQVNWIYTDNNVAVRMSTKAATVPYLEQILDEEILSDEENNGDEEILPEEENNG